MKTLLRIVAVGVVCIACGSNISIAQDDDEILNIAVYDFLPVSVYGQYFQQQSIQSPVNLRTDPIVSHEEFANLPPEKQAEIKQRELEERISRRQEAQRIAVQRYNEDLSRREAARNAAQGTPFGRSILSGTHNMEAALLRHSDIFSIYSRRQGEEAFQQEANLAQIEGIRPGASYAAPHYTLEARVEPLSKEDHQVMTQGSALRSRKYFLDVTISLIDPLTRQIKFSETFKENKTVRAMGGDFPDEDRVLREMLAEISANAADRIYDTFVGVVTVTVRPPREDRNYDVNDVDLQVDGNLGITSLGDGKYEIKLRRDRSYRVVADAFDFIAEQDVRLARTNPSVTLSLVPRYITLNLRFAGLDESFDPNNVVVRVENMDPEKGGTDEFFGAGPHAGIERGRYRLTLEADGYQPLNLQKSWNRGGVQSEAVRFTRSASNVQ